jgi:hypothetical protein
MRGETAPMGDGGLIAPDRQRQQMALAAPAFEALDRDEAVDLHEFRPQRPGDVEIAVELGRFRLRLEDHCEHPLPLAVLGAAIMLHHMDEARWHLRRRSLRCRPQQ